MSKERLEEIKQYLKHFHNAVDVEDCIKAYIFNTLKVEWLIEQAEKKQSLETTIDFYESALRDADRRVQELEEIIYQDERQAVLEGLYEQNKRYREALEFYAEQDNYEWETSYRPQQEIDCMVIDDGGHTARKALEGEE